MFPNSAPHERPRLTSSADLRYLRPHIIRPYVFVNTAMSREEAIFAEKVDSVVDSDMSEEGEGAEGAVMFGSLDVILLVGLVVVVAAFLLRLRSRRREKIFRKLSINPG